MPAAGRKPTEQASASRFFIEVERLGVECVCERLDLRLVERVDAAREPTSDVEVFEVEKLVGRSYEPPLARSVVGLPSASVIQSWSIPLRRSSRAPCCRAKDVRVRSC
jgi:hypothetical protein